MQLRDTTAVLIKIPM